MRRIFHHLMWPVVHFHLNNTRRTRVLIIHNDEVLLVQSRLDRPMWGVPGGGIHRNESDKQGALREINEELGIDAKTSQLLPLFESQEKRPKYTYKAICFVLVADTKNFKKHWLELRHAGWFKLDELPEPLQPLTGECIQAWKQIKSSTQKTSK